MPKRLLIVGNIGFSLVEGCSEGLDAFRFFFKNYHRNPL